MSIEIKSEQDGMRLDIALCQLILDYSRSHILRILKDGKISVNGISTTKRCFVYTGDTIEISFDAERNKENQECILEPTIHHVTDDYIILSKPSGLVVHPAHMYHGVTLIDYLLVHFPEIKKVGENPVRPGIVHRLDKDASGIMVIARTQDMFDVLKRQFKLHEVQKEYYIVTYGIVSPRESEISFPIARSKRKNGIFVRSKEGRNAVTRYEVEEYIQKYSLVHVFPETGRTHQIRVHFFSCGYPLVGDHLYRNKKIKEVSCARLMLHAVRLRFKDVKGISQEYRVEPSADFMNVIKEIRGS